MSFLHFICGGVSEGVERGDIAGTILFQLGQGRLHYEAKCSSSLEMRFIADLSKELEAAERIALPMISFAGRRLTVLATLPFFGEYSTLSARAGLCKKEQHHNSRGMM